MMKTNNKEGEIKQERMKPLHSCMFRNSFSLNMTYPLLNGADYREYNGWD